MTITPLDCTILAYVQILQPTTAEEAYAATREVFAEAKVDSEIFRTHFNSLERERFLWSTGDKQYVTTPKASPLIEKAIAKKQRDKLRLLFLNRQRYNLDRMHRL
jgi:hypothetical protein